MWFVLEELQKMEVWLGDRIEGRWSGLERYVLQSKKEAEERLVSLEMFRSVSEQGT